ncbi:hypothetical protein B9G52_08585 [Bacillus safensis]|nr:hypothetical protein [Bacillus safensis]
MGIQKKTNGKGDVIRPFLFYLFSSISFKKRLSKHINSAIILILKVLSKGALKGQLGAFHLGFMALSQMREKRFWEKRKAS